MVILLFLVISAAAVGAAGSGLTKAKVQKAQKTIPGNLYTENYRSRFAELNPLRMEEYPEITAAVKDYYSQQEEETGFVESYDDLCIWVHMWPLPDMI